MTVKQLFFTKYSFSTLPLGKTSGVAFQYREIDEWGLGLKSYNLHKILIDKDRERYYTGES